MAAKFIVFILDGKTNTSDIENKKIEKFAYKEISSGMDKNFESVQEIRKYLRLL